MTLIVTIVFNVIGLAGTYLAAAMHRELPLTGWLDNIPWPEFGRKHAKGRAGTQGWRLSDAPDRRRSGRPVNGPQTPPRAHGGAGDPRTAHSKADETGARRTRPRKDSPCTTAAGTAATATTRTAGGAPKAATTTNLATTTADFPVPRGRHHAAQPLGLKFDANRGQWRHAETGPLAIPAGYGENLRAAKRLVQP